MPYFLLSFSSTLSFALTVATTLLFVTASPLAAANSEAQRAQKKLTEIRKQIDALKDDLKKNKSSKNSLEKELKNSEQDINSLRERVNDLKKKIESTSTKIETSRSQQSQLELQRKAQSKQFANHLVTQYKHPSTSQLKLLLSDTKPRDIERISRYHKAISGKIDSDIRLLQETIHSKKQIEKSLVANALEQKKNKRSLELQKNILAEQQRKQKLLLSSLGRSISRDTRQVAILENDQKRLETLLAKLAKTSTQRTQFGSHKGRLAWPVNGKVLRSFGSAKVQNRVKWNGILISATDNDYVNAAHSGAVIFSEFLRGHGKLAIVDHGEGYMTLYAHNQHLYKSVGELVQAGEALGVPGTANGFNSPTLYFELRYKGKPQDPVSWLALR